MPEKPKFSLQSLLQTVGGLVVIVGTLLGVAVKAEHRMTTVETQHETIMKDADETKKQVKELLEQQKELNKAIIAALSRK